MNIPMNLTDAIAAMDTISLLEFVEQVQKRHLELLGWVKSERRNIQGDTYPLWAPAEGDTGYLTLNGALGAEYRRCKKARGIA